MSKGSKRGFIPPRPAAALSGLDFAHASEAYRRALEVPASTPGASDFLDQCADRLIAIPTTNPLQIAEKVSALAYRSRACAVPLSDRAAQLRIIDNGTDEQQRLLAIYLDLTAPKLDPHADYISRATAALEMERRAIAGDRVAEAKAIEPVSAAINEADALPATPENIAAKLMGLRLIYENSGGFDELEDVTTDTRLMRDIMKGLLAQAGGPHPDAFNPCIWVGNAQRQTGCAVSVTDDHVHLTGGDATQAVAMWEALSPQQKLIVRDWLSNRREAA